MTRRIVLDSSPRFRVSDPGYDALTGADANMAFDPLAYGYAGVYLAGTIPWASWTMVDHADDGNGNGFSSFETTISFGKTFSAPPHVFWLPIIGGVVYAVHPKADKSYTRTSTSDVVLGAYFRLFHGVVTDPTMDAAYRICQQ